MTSGPRLHRLAPAMGLGVACLAVGSLDAQITVRGESAIPPDPVLRGWVRAADSYAGVPGAFVAQVAEATGTFTDEEGRFEVTLPSGASMVLVVGHEGYETVSFELPDSLLGRPLVLPLPPRARPPERALPSLEHIYRRMERQPREGELFVARPGAGELAVEGGTALDAILSRVDDSVDRCSNGRLCSSRESSVRGLVQAREVLLCVDGRWTGGRDVVALVTRLTHSRRDRTPAELLEAIPAADVYGAEILRLEVRRRSRPFARAPSGDEPSRYRVHVYTRGFMAANLARDAMQLPPVRC